MKDIIQRVRGAVAKKNLLPVLTHFLSKDGELQGSNGYITIGAPCEGLPGDFTVPAVPFLRAVDACDGEPQITRTNNDRLRIQHGRFHATIATGSVDMYPCVSRLTDRVAVPTALLPGLRALRPFVGSDAFRLWSHGVLLLNGYMWATNNVTLARTPFQCGRHPVVWPSMVVDELLRHNQEPVEYAQTDTRAEFVFADDSWLSTTLLVNKWPDVEQFWSAPWSNLEGPDVGTLRSAVQRVAPFCADYPYVRLTDQGVECGDDTVAAAVELPGLPPATLRLEPFAAVLEAATVVDFTRTPYRWFGHQIEGLLTGATA